MSWFLHQTTTGRAVCLDGFALFISWFLHQTTTSCNRSRLCCRCLSLDSYIKPQLITTPDNKVSCCLSLDSYIKPQLLHLLPCHPVSCLSLDSYIKPQLGVSQILTDSGCLSLDSYIKPQRPPSNQSKISVVYLLIPTSNHNMQSIRHGRQRLFISWFLHQTTTVRSLTSWCYRCLSLDSYIKPQHRSDA